MKYNLFIKRIRNYPSGTVRLPTEQNAHELSRQGHFSLTINIQNTSQKESAWDDDLRSNQERR